MKDWLKKYFIPHEDNDHRPHMLRSEAVLFVAIILAGIEAIFLMQAFLILPRSNFFALIVPNVLVDEANANRESYNFSPLKTNPFLEAAAVDKANDMAGKGYFAHTSPTGLTPWYWIQKVGYRFSYAGENLAVNFIDSSDVTQAWMNSPSHRENILNGNFTEIGIATAQGTYEGHEATFVVQFFGKPALSYVYAAAGETPSLPAKQTPGVVEQPSKPPAEKVITSTVGNETFVAVKGEEVSADASPVATLGAASGASEEASNLDAIIASPRKTVNYIFYIAGLLTLAALMLNIFVKIRVQHARLIMNGLFVLLVVAGVLLLNQYVALSQIRIL